MKRSLLIGCIFSALTGCTMTVADKVAPGVYVITSRGSVLNSREGMLENINQKAAKVCNGKYQLVGDSGANMIINTTTQLGPTPTTILGLKAVCEEKSE